MSSILWSQQINELNVYVRVREMLKLVMNKVKIVDLRIVDLPKPWSE